MLIGLVNKIAQQLLTNHKLPNSPTAKLLGIFSVGQSIAQLLGKIWLNKVTSKIVQNGKNITVSMVSRLNSWFDRTSMLMIEPYPTPKPNPTDKPNHIPCPKPNYVDKF